MLLILAGFLPSGGELLRYAARAGVYRWVRHLPFGVVEFGLLALVVLVVLRFLFGGFRRRRGYR